MNTPTPLPIILIPEAIKRLISDHRIEIDARARFALGASGLSSAEVGALDIGHVSVDGIGVRSIIIVPNRDGRRPQLEPTRRQAISDDARWLLGCWLEVRRRRCEHQRRLMRTYTDERGVLRCSECREVLDFVAAPLFDSRESDRMSLSAIRHEFQRARDMLGLDPSFHFDSLRETYLAREFSGGQRRGQR
jgi:hypothetical protein